MCSFEWTQAAILPQVSGLCKVQRLFSVSETITPFLEHRGDGVFALLSVMDDGFCASMHASSN